MGNEQSNQGQVLQWVPNSNAVSAPPPVRVILPSSQDIQRTRGEIMRPVQVPRQQVPIQQAPTQAPMQQPRPQVPIQQVPVQAPVQQPRPVFSAAPAQIAYQARPAPQSNQAGPVTMAQLTGAQKFLGGYFVGGPDDSGVCPISIIFLLIMIILISVAIALSSYLSTCGENISQQKNTK